MKKKLLLNLLIFAVFSALVISCSSEATNPEQNGTLNLYLTDAQTDYDEVNITFSEISAHIDSDWVTVLGEEVMVNLLDYNNGKTFLLASEPLPIGKYTQIRLHITDANVVVDNETIPMKVPSEKLKLGPQFTMEEGIAFGLIMDFDASRSVVVSGPKDNPKYKLKPHIRVVPEAVTGSISGNVLNHQDYPIAYAIVAGDTVATSIVKDDGTFVLGFLEGETHQVDIQDSVGLYHSESGVSVIIGENTDLGDITLQ
ncbi:MAG: DUF4382 domain-containing protein [Bacteroidota bacterium]